MNSGLGKMLVNQDQAVRTPTIFVLDDDDAVRDSLAVLLPAMGYHTQAFGSVAEFLAGFHAGELSPDCVILDVHLPDGDGRALSAALVAERPSLPIILMSGRNSGDMEADALNAGAFAFLDKPVSHDDLMDTIRRAVAA